MEVIIIMKKAFLSHNSADKEYVLQVANELGYSSGIIDTHHFEEGHDQYVQKVTDALLIVEGRLENLKK